MKELIGKTVKQIFVSDDQQLIKFVTNNADIIYYADGDCCSETWFADILFGYKFFDTEIESVEALDVPEWVTHMANKDGRGRQEEDEVYGFQLKTVCKQQGIYSSRASWCDIIFRNSSNGYYGGSCEYLDPNNSWGKEKIVEAVWEEITEDWKA